MIRLVTIFILINFISGCLSTKLESTGDSSSSSPQNSSSSPNVVHNLLAYREISLKEELERYDNISSIRIEDLNGPNAVFISGDSVYKNQIIKFNASSNSVKVQLNLANGSAISLLKR